MNKKHKIIIISCIFIALLAIILILHFTRNPNILMVSFKKHYSVLYEEYPELEISVFTNQPTSTYFSKDIINSAYISTETDEYQVKIIDATLTKNNIQYEHEELIEGRFKFKLQFNSNDLIALPNAILKLNYKNGEILNINVGNICFYKSTNYDEIQIERVQAIVNNFGLYDSMVAVVIDVVCKNDIIVKDIVTISPSVMVNYDYFMVQDAQEIDHGQNIDELLGVSYNYQRMPTSTFSNMSFPKNLKKELIIPLAYKDNEFVDNVGFIITYESNGIEYQQVVNPYRLFSSSTLTYFANECTITKN